MSIKYELHTIKNSENTGATRHFVRLFTDPPTDEKTLGQMIQANCSLTEADLRAALVAIGQQMAIELKSGRRFHIPEVGYFWLAAKLDTQATKSGGCIRVRSIRFRPEAALTKSIRQHVRFEKATFTSLSRTYDKEDLWRGIKAYLTHNRCMTRHDMGKEFGLRPTTARKWLKTFVDDKLLTKEGPRNSPVYLLPLEQDTQNYPNVGI